MNLEGKTIILTGARRIGQTVTEELAKRGANLAITYRSSKEESEAMSRTPLKRWGASEIAKAVLCLLDADFVTGVILPVDDGRIIG